MRNSRLGIVLALLSFGSSLSQGQSAAIPGRDLLSYPLGLLAEASALPTILGLGLFNPAESFLPGNTRVRLSAASMSTPSDVSASAQELGASVAWRGSTVTLSLVRAAVGGLVRTESDPLTVGTDVAYSTLVASVGVSSRASSHLVWGAALRSRTGQLDLDQRTALSVDVGFVAEHLGRVDGRVGASTFLASPWRSSDDPTTWQFSADARVAGADSLHAVRVGASASSTANRPSEQFLFASFRYQAWEVRGGPARTQAYGSTNVRARFAVAVHHGGYSVGLAREEPVNGLTPSYQFVLSSLIP